MNEQSEKQLNQLLISILIRVKGYSFRNLPKSTQELIWQFLLMMTPAELNYKDEYKVDAERYRYLRNTTSIMTFEEQTWVTSHKLDMRVDKAMLNDKRGIL